MRRRTVPPDLVGDLDDVALAGIDQRLQRWSDRGLTWGFHVAGFWAGTVYTRFGAMWLTITLLAASAFLALRRATP